MSPKDGPLELAIEFLCSIIIDSDTFQAIVCQKAISTNFEPVDFGKRFLFNNLEVKLLKQAMKQNQLQNHLVSIFLHSKKSIEPFD